MKLKMTRPQSIITSTFLESFMIDLHTEEDQTDQKEGLGEDDEGIGEACGNFKCRNTDDQRDIGMIALDPMLDGFDEGFDEVVGKE